MKLHESFAVTTVFRKWALVQVVLSALLSHTDCQTLKLGKIFYPLTDLKLFYLNSFT